MLKRRIEPEVAALLEQAPAVVLVGPRQVGKTTLALAIARDRNNVYLDLESASDRARLAEPELYFSDHADELVVLDEIHRAPGIFEALRGTIDQGRRENKGTGRFLLLGSAAVELLAQAGETLAGRIAFVELSPFDVTEAGDEPLDRLWVRGGLPESFLAADDKASLRWRRDFIRTYLEQRRHGRPPPRPDGRPAAGASAATTVGQRRQAPGPLSQGLRARQRTRPRTARPGRQRGRARPPGCGRKLGGPCDREPDRGRRRSCRAELLPDEWRRGGRSRPDLGHGREWAVEVKRSLAPKVERGLRSALTDLQPERSFIVYPGNERYRLGTAIEAIDMASLCAELIAR